MRRTTSSRPWSGITVSEILVVCGILILIMGIGFALLAPARSKGIEVVVVQERGVYRPFLGQILVALSRRAGESPRDRYVRLLRAMEAAGIHEIEYPLSQSNLKIDRMREFVDGRIEERSRRTFE